MPREGSPFEYGGYWLDKRRDGKSPDIWQIASGTRQISYRSTRQRGLEDAKSVLIAHANEQAAKRPQSVEDALVIPALLTYWKEHGSKAVAPQQIASSLRAFMGFLFQDEAGMSAAVADLTPAVFVRFREWRMKAHSYDVPWGGKDYRHSSPGVKGESVSRNLDDVRAALNHAETNSRFLAPKVPAVPKQHRSKPRDRVLTWAELGMIAWYARHFDDLGRYVSLLLGTAARPIAIAKFNIGQFDGRNIDLHPTGSPQTAKVNPTIPAIRPLRLILTRWEGTGPVDSRKRAWRTMRRTLGLSDDVVSKTIRHTIATELYTNSDVPDRQLSALLGHAGPLNRTTSKYVHMRPDHMKAAAKALERIWIRVQREANAYGAVHRLSIPRSEGGIIIDKMTVTRKDNGVFRDGGR